MQQTLSNRRPSNANADIQYASDPHFASSNLINRSAPGPVKLSTISLSETPLTICLSSGFRPSRDGDFVGVDRLLARPVDSWTNPKVSKLATTSRNSVVFKGCNSPSSRLHSEEYLTNKSFTVGIREVDFEGVAKGSRVVRFFSLARREQRTAFCCKFTPASRDDMPLLKMLEESLAI